MVQTDHRSLKWIDKAKDTYARLTHWSLALQPYQFTEEHRQGKANCNADTLSWMSSEECCTPRKQGKDVKNALQNAIPKGSHDQQFSPTDQSGGTSWSPCKSSTYIWARPDTNQLATQDWTATQTSKTKRVLKYCYYYYCMLYYYYRIRHYCRYCI